jgi:4-aminobutyrate aminotransferase-like enzyme
LRALVDLTSTQLLELEARWGAHNYAPLPVVVARAEGVFDALGGLGGVVRSVRGRGLLVGIELDRPARPYCEQLMMRGVLCKDTHDTVIRLAPPLVIDEADLRWMAREIGGVFN